MQLLISALHFDWDSIEQCLDRAANELGLDGVELSLHRSMQRPHCTLADLEELPRAGARFDLIITAHIWEDLAQLGPVRGEQALLSWLDVCNKAGIGDLVVHGGSFLDRKEGLERVRDLLARVAERLEKQTWRCTSRTTMPTTTRTAASC